MSTSGIRHLAFATAVALGSATMVASPVAAGFDRPPINPNPPKIEQLPCEQVWCTPDYVAEAKPTGRRELRSGRLAHEFVVVFENQGLSNPGPIISTLKSSWAESRNWLVDAIVDVDVVDESSNVVIQSHLDTIAGPYVWTVHHLDGLAPGDPLKLRVWVTKDRRGQVSLRAEANALHNSERAWDDYSPVIPLVKQREARPWNNSAYAVR